MSPSKKQKTARDSAIFLNSDSDSSESAFESVRPHKNNKSSKASKNQKTGDPAHHDYICIHRPFFDVEGANWLAWSNDPFSHVEKKDVWSKLYKPSFDAENQAGIYNAPAHEHKDHKWVIMWDAWLKTDLLNRKAKYCDPDAFGLTMYNDWRGWGMQEIVENTMLEFDRAFRIKDEKRTKEMWIVISAVGLWLNSEEHIGALIANEDGETICELIGLLGCALLTALAAIEHAGELDFNSRFLDLALVIAYYLELSHDLPAYGIEGKSVAWRKEAVKYFKKGNLDPEKGLFATQLRIEKLKKADDHDDNSQEKKAEEVGSTSGTSETAPIGTSVEAPIYIPDNEDSDKENANPQEERNLSPSSTRNKKRKLEEIKASEQDPWQWVENFKRYKQKQGASLGGQKYDITKMSRADRAATAIDGKDPLADVAVKDLKDDLLDFD
ncbi:hypothetical protein EJ02DRAFT_376613 [Clathrospora elynae]|uniref:Uncharacterized protein n=1 Tax=Clathrospora elynae TaxID=706981 RepID=A0A6A5SQJ3_9PLEO|nr:hypothetical protein EJ02DRAFT_376613 [Clathrospora elynae]